MNTKKLKNLILFQFFLTISLAIKALFYPYALAPEELSTAILAYDDLQPLPDTFTSIMIFVILIISIVSLIMVYKLKKIGRLLYLIAIAASFLLIFSGSYFVYDPLELFLEITITFISGAVISLAYFSSLSKSFK